MKNIIETRAVTKSYFSEEGLETAVLHGIDLEIPQGQFIALMGPSGAGKSTLLHILGFLDKHTTGEYFFEGKKMDEYNDIERALIRNKQLGFIFQSFNLLPRTSVLENVKLPLLYSQIPKSKWNDLAEKAIESVGLTYRISHEPSQLSGGEKQRVAIARALVCNPEVIFADEPTGNLDTHSGGIIMDIIRKLHEKEGKTIVLITHETNTAQHAERIIHLVDGMIDKDFVVKDRIKTFFNK